MTVAVRPDAEAIIGKYLRSRSEIKALGARVLGEAPDDRSTPWVQVVQLDYGAVGDSRSDHLLSWFGQLSCYAGAEGGQAEASKLARTVIAAIVNLAEEEVEGAVVTGARIISAPRIPDTEGFEKARERFPVSVEVWLHA